MARVFLLYLKQNIKPYMSNGLRAELEILKKKQSAQLSIDRELDSIDRARQNCTLNSAVTWFQLYIKDLYFKQV